MVKESFKTIGITLLCLKDKNLSELSNEEIADLFENTHDEILEILNSKEQPKKIKTFSKSELGL